MNKNHSILIVDDNLLWTETLKDTLSNSLPNVKISIASSSEEALKYINTKSFDIAICDLRLSEFDIEDRSGFNLISYIIKNSSYTKVIVVTGYSEYNIIRNLYQLGILGAVEKSNFNMSEFIILVNKALEKIVLEKEIIVETPKTEEIPDTAMEFLENILHGFLHNLGKYIGSARIASNDIYDSIMKSPDKIDQKLLKELDVLRQSIEGIRLISERLRNVAGREPAIFKLLDINELIHNVIKQSEYNNLDSFEVNLEKNLPKIEGDRELLWHLIENIVSNAFDAIDKKKGKVEIKTLYENTSKNI